MPTPSLGYQSFYQATLTAGISDTDLTIPLDTAPIPDEGFLVLESTTPDKREIIYYTSKTPNSVICPADGRGYDGTTATTHQQNAAVIMAPVGIMFSSLRDLFTTTPQGWTSVATAVNSVTANGNRSYTIGFASDVSATLSEGMRVRTTRTVASRNTSFLLDGTNDYYVKTSPSGMTFTDDFSVSAWVYLTSYPTGVPGTIVARFNNTSGFVLRVDTDGRISNLGYNSSPANYSRVQTRQSIPLNKWVHIAAQLDMSAFTATTTTSYVMVDGVDVPCAVDRGGTNPTALVQAGNLEIGSYNGGTAPFPGYITEVAIYSAKVTQATHLARMHQGIVGNEATLISAYGNGSVNDLSATGNNLTATNGATTIQKAPFGNNGVSTTLDYGLIMNVSTTDVVVQVPEGCTIPTSGGVTSVDYSTVANPYGWVSDKGRWVLGAINKVSQIIGVGSINGWWPSSFRLSVPTGSFELKFEGAVARVTTVPSPLRTYYCLEKATPTNNVYTYPILAQVYNAASVGAAIEYISMSGSVSLGAATDYILYGSISAATGSETWELVANTNSAISATPQGL
jgi:hypothetical protein